MKTMSLANVSPYKWCKKWDRVKYIQMKSALDKLIKPEEDSIRFYLLCKNCAKNIVISGLGTYTEDENVIII